MSRASKSVIRSRSTVKAVRRDLAGSPKKSGTATESVAVDFRFPGHGGDCGRSGFRTVGHFAGRSVHWRKVHESCHRRDCPSHWRDWMGREADAVEHRLRCGQSAQVGGRVYQRWVVSPPPTVQVRTVRDFQALYRKSYAIARKVGVVGGAHIYHNERIPSKFNDRDDREVGPHFHGVGVGFIDPEAVKAVYEATGWVVKGLGRPDDFRDHVVYVLSHAGVPWPVNPASSQSTGLGLHLVRWFGALSYNQFQVPDPPRAVKCPVCGLEIPFSDWYTVHFPTGPPEADSGEAAAGAVVVDIVDRTAWPSEKVRWSE